MNLNVIHLSKKVIFQIGMVLFFIHCIFYEVSCQNSRMFMEEEVVFMNERDGTRLAEFLSQNNVGVLRFDDRGVGGSKGDIWNATVDVLAGDAYAGVKYLKSREDIDNRKIGLIGHSLGAMQGTILASKHPDIDFLVMLGGIGITWSENHIKADSQNYCN